MLYHDSTRTPSIIATIGPLVTFSHSLISSACTFRTKVYQLIPLTMPQGRRMRLLHPADTFHGSIGSLQMRSKPPERCVALRWVPPFSQRPVCQDAPGNIRARHGARCVFSVLENAMVQRSTVTRGLRKRRFLKVRFTVVWEYHGSVRCGAVRWYKSH